MTQISEELVKRDEYGFWSHSVFDEFGDEEIIPEDWFTSRGVKVASVKFEYDAPEELQNDWFEDGEPDCSAWNPSRPEGDGWFVLSIHDTDDGPICVWAHPIHAIK
jgi:hypothetical protein